MVGKVVSNGYCVYFIRSNKWIKIGWTGNLEKRLKAFRTGNPNCISLVAMFPCKSRKNAIHLEKMFHEKFADHKRHGEWFTASRVIKKLQKAGKIERKYQQTSLPCYPDGLGLSEPF